jgi:threonine/homoserine/homoserine lactone efflux protein
MPPSDTLLAFLLATLVFAAIPGPAILYAAARTLAQGRAAGLRAALGIAIGGLVHVAAAALGLSALFHAVPPLYAAIKLAGAAYLVWLGIGMLRTSAADTRLPQNAPENAPQAAPQTASRAAATAFRQSILVEVLNPKTALFFLAFLPQFVDPAAALPVPLQFVILGVTVTAIFGMADLLAVLCAAAIAGRVAASGRAARWANRAGGAVLVGLGLRLAADRA